MSSGNLMQPSDPDLFRWHDRLDSSDYVFASYEVVAHCPSDKAAVGMAMEQSASTVAIAGYVTAQQVQDWTIRVVSVRDCAVQRVSGVLPYGLATEVYPVLTAARGARIELAVPKRLLADSYVQLLNVLVGELPRLGFLSTWRLCAVKGLTEWGPGPAFGVPGIRQRLGVAHGPLLCRSMRPAVGLDTATMVRLTHDVLCGGFHCVKDDELMVFPSNHAFEQHVRAMLDAKNRASATSNERKAYLATLICEPQDLLWRWELCCRLGVDGVLFAPFIQGLGQLAQLARQRVLPILAHNTGAEVMTRNPEWGVHEAVWNEWLRCAGADWLVTSGGYGNQYPPAEAEQHALRAIAGVESAQIPVMPILQGGKHPSGLSTYTACVGSDDYMLIVASWIDGHEQGLIAGAREFRDAVEMQASLG